MFTSASTAAAAIPTSSFRFASLPCGYRLPRTPQAAYFVCRLWFCWPYLVGPLPVPAFGSLAALHLRYPAGVPGFRYRYSLAHHLRTTGSRLIVWLAAEPPRLGLSRFLLCFAAKKRAKPIHRRSRSAQMATPPRESPPASPLVGVPLYAASSAATRCGSQVYSLILILLFGV